jgi:hypothetical protein
MDTYKLDNRYNNMYLLCINLNSLSLSLSVICVALHGLENNVIIKNQWSVIIVHS